MENQLSNQIVTYYRFPKKKCATKNLAFNICWHVKRYLKMHFTSFQNLKLLFMFI